MAITQIPPVASLVDDQFLQVAGPDGITTGYHYDSQQRALYFKESEVIFPHFHGPTHIAQDPIPAATCDTQGLMAADDKCKLDSLLQMRIGVAGFQGAGFPDDGGWMQGDIILAAGTDFISLERIGNIIRFTVDSPIPLNCACFLPGARVLMADGTTKPIEDIIVGDLVVTHTGSAKRVKTTFVTPHNGPVYGWRVDKHSGEGLFITGNHPVMALERGHAFMPSGKARKAVKEPPTWTEAGRLRPGDLISRRRSHNIVDDIAEIDVLKTLGAGFVERDGLVYSCRTGESRDGQVDGMSHGIPRILKLDNDLLDLLGYYAAEGCADKKNGVRFSVHTEEFKFGDIGAEICRILATIFGLEPKINGRATPNGRDIQVFSVPLVELFRRWFGGTRKQKRFPEWVMRLPTAKQARVVASLIKGDGYIVYSNTKSATRNNVQFTLGLACRNLVDQALWMAERCGWEPSNQEPKINGKRVRYRMMISASAAPDLSRLLGVRQSTKQLSRERRVAGRTLHRLVEWSEHHYKGDVYNFEVETDNSYIVDGLEVHNCEECQQIFWVQDETDLASIRPPTCSGKLPGVNGYGELKMYLMPETTLVDPNSPQTVLKTKDQFPVLIFKRYDDTITPGVAEFELILKRDDINSAQAEIGWSFTPGATGIPQAVWWMGKDTDGNQIRFDLSPAADPGLLGALLYKGNSITKQMGVITDYTSAILGTNQYTCQWWDVDGHKTVGTPFTARNVWQYQNPLNPSGGVNPQALILDGAVDLLPVGTLVDIWSFQVGQVAGEPILRYYFNRQPQFNPTHAWVSVGSVQFGDVVLARQELQQTLDPNSQDAAVQVSAIRDFERTIWGLTGYDDPLLSYDIALTAGTVPADITQQHRAVIDVTLPGLKVLSSQNVPSDFSERPVYLWNRIAAHNAYARIDMGRPSSTVFTPFDVLIRASVDESTEKYMRVTSTGAINGLYFVRVKGVHFHDLPPFGAIRIISPAGDKNLVFNYTRKFVFPTPYPGGTEPTIGSDRYFDDYDSIALAGDAGNNVPYPGQPGDIVELLHQEYNTTCARFEFAYSPATAIATLQVKVGTLDMSAAYENLVPGDVEDFVRGMAAGYTISPQYQQAGLFTGVGAQPQGSPQDFVLYEGGAQVGGTQSEYWNTLELMLREDQLWIWWNRLLLTPSPQLSGSLPTPVVVTTPYFPVQNDVNRPYGKVGLRMWPGAAIRRMDVRHQLGSFSEFNYGQLDIG